MPGLSGRRAGRADEEPRRDHVLWELQTGEPLNGSSSAVIGHVCAADIDERPESDAALIQPAKFAGIITAEGGADGQGTLPLTIPAGNRRELEIVRRIERGAGSDYRINGGMKILLPIRA